MVGGLAHVQHDVRVFDVGEPVAVQVTGHSATLIENADFDIREEETCFFADRICPLDVKPEGAPPAV